MAATQQWGCRGRKRRVRGGSPAPDVAGETHPTSAGDARAPGLWPRPPPRYGRRRGGEPGSNAVFARAIPRVYGAISYACFAAHSVVARM